MTITFILPALIAIIGLIMYLLPTPAKVSEVGRLMFFAGILAICMGQLGDHTGVALHRR